MVGCPASRIPRSRPAEPSNATAPLRGEGQVRALWLGPAKDSLADVGLDQTTRWWVHGRPDDGRAEIRSSAVLEDPAGEALLVELTCR